MIIVLILMILGYIIGYILRNYEKLKNPISKITNICIYIMLLLLGISVGSNQKIINNFSIIGFHALIISLLSILGSIIIAKIIFKLFFKKI